MFKVVLAVIFGLFQALKADKPSPELCVIANENCKEDVFMCGIAYAHFAAACDLTAKPMSTRSHKNWTDSNPPTPKPCSKECLNAISTLKSIKRGKELHECDCQLDGDCLIVKARVAKCLNTTRSRRVRSCTRALWNCTKDPTCRFLQSKFLDDCREMFNGVRCEEKCLKIQDRLFRSTYGKPLMNCECDGRSEAYCRALKGHAEQLRCIPGMDGNGIPVFTYIATDSPFIHGEKEGEPKNNTASFPISSTWTLVVLIATLFLL